MACLYVGSNSRLVVGDCYAANHPHEPQTTAAVGFGLVEHQQVLKKQSLVAIIIFISLFKCSWLVLYNAG